MVQHTPPISPNLPHQPLSGTVQPPPIKTKTEHTAALRNIQQFPHPSQIPQESAKASFERRAEIFLTFQTASQSYDLDNPISSSQLLTSSKEFFTVFSERSGIPLHSLECLTFVFFFGGRNIVVVTKDGGEDEWDRFKERVNRLYCMARERWPEKRNFEIWVDAGDTRDIER
jgi:hypothetical protein